ncbi:MAG: peptidoglycan editing factor PgeF [Betaproteobacteria bacterium]|nr:peptidoglycan editing factor PgeF [Betaproteobacteria bacterium]
MCHADWIVPDWPAPTAVKALITTRNGGASRGPFASCNLSERVGDDPQAVAANRRLLLRCLPQEPKWLAQVHGADVADADALQGVPRADASVARRPGTVCAAMIADCVPVLLCDRDATVVAIAHAGWRGLSSGVIENTVRRTAVAPERLIAYLGPGIGPLAFEVGDDVRDAFITRDAQAAHAFAAQPGGKWLADLYSLARQRLARLGVEEVHGGNFCTFGERERFFSYRRDRTTGRMAALVWMHG